MKKHPLTLAILAAQEDEYYSTLEREHMGDPELGTGIYDHEVMNPMGKRPVMFGESGNASEVLDFNLYLSPQEAMTRC